MKKSKDNIEKVSGYKTAGFDECEMVILSYIRTREKDEEQWFGQNLYLLYFSNARHVKSRIIGWGFPFEIRKINFNLKMV